jgi:hypothetical protein
VRQLAIRVLEVIAPQECEGAGGVARVVGSPGLVEESDLSAKVLLVCGALVVRPAIRDQA